MTRAIVSAALAAALLLVAAPVGAATAQHFKPLPVPGPVHPPIATPIVVHVTPYVPPFGGIGSKLPSAKHGRAFSISVSFGGPRK